MKEKVSFQEQVSKIKSLVETKLAGSHDSRLKHIFGVAKMAEFLAKKYNVDCNKALIAAYMHDYMKYDDFEVMLSYLQSEEDKAECKKWTMLAHAYSSAEALKKEAMIFDEDIYNAVRNHVFGRIGMSKLEEIILISDYTEENRMYLDCIKAREILLSKGIDEAIYYSTLYTIEYLIKENKVPHPMQKAILDYYKEKITNGNFKENN